MADFDFTDFHNISSHYFYKKANFSPKSSKFQNLLPFNLPLKSLLVFFHKTGIFGTNKYLLWIFISLFQLALPTFKRLHGWLTWFQYIYKHIHMYCALCTQYVCDKVWHRINENLTFPYFKCAILECMSSREFFAGGSE